MGSKTRECKTAITALVAFAIPVLLTAQVHHYEYVFSRGQIDVYDIDNSFVRIKSIPVSTYAGPLGSVASAATRLLYISYRSNGTTGVSMLKYDLLQDQVIWIKTYPFRIDNMSISPNGKAIYVQTDENNPAGVWEVIESTSGNLTGSIDIVGRGSHDAVPSGAYNFLVESDPVSHAILQRIGPVTASGSNGIQPFAVNDAKTLAFLTATGLLGFQVGDIRTGKILYTVSILGFPCIDCASTAPSHGISMSPDGKEVYVTDLLNSYVRVYDITGLPGSAPKQVANISLQPASREPGWMHHSRDGHYVFVGGSGDVIDTTTRKTVATLPALANSATSIEIDFENGVPVWVMGNRSSASTVNAATSSFDTTTFHGDRQRTGWQQNETILTPQNIAGGTFGPIWNSPAFDRFGINPAHAYASPLYVDAVTISSGRYAGGTFSVVLAATSNNFVYAVNAFATTVGSAEVPAGTILWSHNLGTPATNTNLDNVPLGILGTPTVDTSAMPPRLYVVSADVSAGHQVFALDIASGNILTGWPLAINNGTLSPINQNGPAIFQPVNATSQRGALNLSPDGGILYVPFGAYVDGGAGWLVAIDTRLPALLSAFSGAPSIVATANAGMWASSGVAIDTAGKVFSTTGNGTTGSEAGPGYWGNSLLVWQPGTPLSLLGTYTPFNYCQMDMGDIDLGGGGAMLVPSLADTGGTTPHLVAFGGKQGNVYLVDTDHLPGSLTSRQGCGTDASRDLSLLPPGTQPQFGSTGPLNVFGPYSETVNNLDFAKARSTPAFWRGADGTPYLFFTGSNKAAATSSTSVPPGIYRLKIVSQAGRAAYLQVDGFENTLTFLTPGSPVVSSDGSSNAVVWVLEANIYRSQALNVPSQPFLVALDARTLQKLYQSTAGDLFVGGKYNTPAIAHGTVFVATDRIQAFGLNGPPPSPPIINSFTATPTAINAAQSSILAWNIDRPVTSLTIDQGVGSVAGLTNKSVSPAATTVYTLTATNAQGSTTKSVTVMVTSLPPASLPFAMNACGPAAASFLAEIAAFTAGGNCTRITASTVDVTGVVNAAPAAVYQTKRTGQNGVGYTYTIQLPPSAVPGKLYTVRLHFADDLSSAAGQRVFNVAFNGKVVLLNFDIFAITGKKMKALVKDIQNVAPNAKTQIVIQGLYVKPGQNPLISGLAIISQ